MKKGLRQVSITVSTDSLSWNHCPDEEGIKTSTFTQINENYRWNHCPDEEGIKTDYRLHYRKQYRWNHCPDEEGIKTIKTGPPIFSSTVGTIALMKKGLRRHSYCIYSSHIELEPLP